MRKPNDKKRPNTQGSVEDKARKRNLKYLWVSKQLIWLPVLDENGEDTGLREAGTVKKGKTAFQEGYMSYELGHWKDEYIDFEIVQKERAEMAAAYRRRA